MVTKNPERVDKTERSGDNRVFLRKPHGPCFPITLLPLLKK